MQPAAVDPPDDQAAVHPVLIRRVWRHILKVLQSIAARIDLAHFPGSCCG
jgi:hypothetical protein